MLVLWGLFLQKIFKLQDNLNIFWSLLEPVAADGTGTTIKSLLMHISMLKIW